MTDLSRSEIEWVREDGPSVVTNGAFQTLCDMALRTHDAEADRDNYRAKFLREREATDEWATRAQRAEAECERLRDGLRISRRHVVDAKEHADDESISPVWQAQCHADLEFIDNALATPPPESEPDTCGLCGCSLAGVKSYPVEFLGLQVAVCPDCAEREGDSTDASHTPEQGDVDPHSLGTSDLPGGVGPNAHKRQFDAPEQAHGDALAVADEILYALMNGDVLNSVLASMPDEPWDQMRNTIAAFIRRPLDGRGVPKGDYYEGFEEGMRAGHGVPYVPEEVRRLPDSWNDEGLRVNGATSEFDHGYKAAKYEDADALAKALASAPADGWVLVPRKPTQEMLQAWHRDYFDTPDPDGDGFVDPDREAYKAMIAAAPQRGGEHEA